MNVFLVWSDERSHAIALSLKKLLETCVHGPSYFISDDIPSGRLWRYVLAEELSASDFGIVCITPENRRNPWMHFEAGAIAKAVSESRVVPYLFDLQPADVEPPLADFQALSATENDTRRLALQIANARETSNEDAVERIFDGLAWPIFEEELTDLPVPEGDEGELGPRDQREKIDEILQRLRSLDSGHNVVESSAIWVSSKTGGELVPTYWYVVPVEDSEITRSTEDGDRVTEPSREPIIPRPSPGFIAIDYSEDSALIATKEPIPKLRELSTKEVRDECARRDTTYEVAMSKVKANYA